MANLRPVKGLDVLLGAAARLTGEYPDLVFEIAGDGDMRGSLEEMARERGLAERFQSAVP